MKSETKKQNGINEKELRHAIRLCRQKIGAIPTHERKGDVFAHIGEITEFVGITGIGYDFDRQSWFISVFFQGGVGSNLHIGLPIGSDYALIAERLETVFELTD